MNNVLPPDDRTTWLVKFRAMEVPELKQMLADGLGMTATSLLRNACLVQVLEEKKEDLSALRIGRDLLNHLKKIAFGQMLPEVLVHFASKPNLVTAVGNLPLDAQRRLVSGEPVELIVLGDDGKRTSRMADPLKMTQRQVKQVFSREGVRDSASQHLVLDDRREKAGLPIPETVCGLKIDKVRGGIVVGRKFIPLADLVVAVKVLQK